MQNMMNPNYRTIFLDKKTYTEHINNHSSLLKPLLIKYLLIHVFLGLFYIVALYYVSEINANHLASILLYIGFFILASTILNGIYSYYSKKNKNLILYSYVSTSFYSVIIWILFITLDILILKMIGNIYVFRLTIAFFWCAVITFDYIDWKSRKTTKH